MTNFAGSNQSGHFRHGHQPGDEVLGAVKLHRAFTGPVQFDSAEDLITRLVPVAEVPGLVASGKIRHSLIVAALYYYELARR